jgi:hypothetical protein
MSTNGGSAEVRVSPETWDEVSKFAPTIDVAQLVKSKLKIYWPKRNPVPNDAVSILMTQLAQVDGVRTETAQADKLCVSGCSHNDDGDVQLERMREQCS